MKILIGLACVVFIQINIYAQKNFIQIVTPQNEWVAEIAGWVGPTFITRYTFSKDSFYIKGNFYHQLLYDTEMSGEWRPSPSYFREDSGRVYKVRDTMQFEEKLLYDFNFNVGDTLPLQNDGWDNHRRVVEVGSTQLSDGIHRKFIKIECTTGGGAPDTTTWIEGMGDVEEIFGSENYCAQWDEGTSYLFCFSTDGEQLYQRDGIVDCFTSGVENMDQGELIVFPNPVSDVLHFNADHGLLIDQILLYNANGIVVYQSREPSLDQLDISGFAPGFYHGIIFYDGNKIQPFKFVVVR